VSWREGAACRGQDPDIFFPTKLVNSTVNRARAICSDCPVFAECLEWGTENYDLIQGGILFGVGPVERSLMAAGAVRWRDWRKGAGTLSKATMDRLEAEAIRDGEPAVVAIRGIYSERDRDKRVAIIQAYQDWQDAQVWRAAEEQVQAKVAEVRQALARTSYGVDGRKAQIPPKFRPACPNGHAEKDMYRIRLRSRKDREAGVEKWRCYLCGYKVRLTPDAWEEALI